MVVVTVLLGVVLHRGVGDDYDLGLAVLKDLFAVAVLASMVRSDKDLRARELLPKIGTFEMSQPTRALQIAWKDDAEVLVLNEGHHTEVVHVREPWIGMIEILDGHAGQIRCGHHRT